MIFNTFLQSLEKSDELKQMGYVYDKILNPKNWFQFADDTVADTSNEYENQVLLNMFTRWCNWSHMIIMFIEKDSRSFFELLGCIRVPENDIIFLTKWIANICIRCRTLYFVGETKNGHLLNF